MERPKSNSLEIELQTKREEILGKAPEFELIRNNVADRIREYSKLQVSLWKQIPNLALEVQGRKSYSDFSVYQDGVLMISFRERQEVKIVYIDLMKSGDMISTAPGGFESTSDENVCAFLRHLDLLDAKPYVETLKIQARRPYGNKDAQKQAEEWRAHIRQQKGWPAITPKDLRLARLSPQESARVKELLKENF